MQPGVVQDDLNRAARKHGLLFGPDTSTSDRATIGGMIGNNSAGSGSVVYGMTIDHVEALEVVLSDASTATLAPVDAAEMVTPELPRTRSRGGSTRACPRSSRSIAPRSPTGFPPYWRRAGGYRLDRLADGPPFNLARFVVGSEGTLVIVTEATVRLVPLPRAKAIAVGHFASVADAIAATEDALSTRPSAVELIDRTILELSRRKIEYAALGSILEGDPGALLFVTFDGDNAAEASASVERLAALWQRHGHGYHTLRATTPRQQAALLKVRSAGLGLLMAASEGTRRPVAFIEDTAVDPARLPEYVRRFSAVLERHGLVAGFYGHCSVGCLHIRPFMDLTQPDEVATMRTVAAEIRDLVSEFGGANSSEHGDGLARSEFNRIVFGDALYDAMCEVKRLFDPHALMNPGKIVDAPPMTENIRDVALPPAFDAANPALVRRHRRHARRGRSMHEHRRLPQGVDRGDVPVVHGDARGGAQHPRPRQRAGARALATGSEGGARRRSSARHPRPLPRVQGVQERVPARRRHGLDEERVSLSVPGDSRRAGARAILRRRAPAQPAGLDVRAALEPGDVAAGIACADGANAGGHPAAAAAAIPPAHAAAVGCAPAAPTSRVARTRRDARQLVHHVHRAGGRHRGGGAAGDGRMGGRADRRSLLRTRRHLQGASRRRRPRRAGR